MLSSDGLAATSLTVVAVWRGRWHDWSTAGVQATVRPVTVTLVVRVSEGEVHETGHKTSSSQSTVTREHALITRRQTTQFPAIYRYRVSGTTLNLRHSQLILLEFRQLLKTHLFCCGPWGLVTVAFRTTNKCIYLLTY